MAKGWPKGKKRTKVAEVKSEKKVEPVVVQELKVVSAIDPVVTSDVIARTYGFLYHPDFEPRAFQKGDVIPDGWVGPEGIVGVFWIQNNEDGSWKKLR